MRKTQGWNWTVKDLGGGTYSTNDARLSVLMDIRDELVRMNQVFQCPNAIRIPRILDEIAANTKRKKRAKKESK